MTLEELQEAINRVEENDTPIYDVIDLQGQIATALTDPTPLSREGLVALGFKCPYDVDIGSLEQLDLHVGDLSVSAWRIAGGLWDFRWCRKGQFGVDTCNPQPQRICDVLRLLERLTRKESQ